MSNPVLVEVTRGNQVESRHRGAVVVVDESGRTVFSLGDTEASTFPRSACKAMQALPLVESNVRPLTKLLPGDTAEAAE